MIVTHLLAAVPPTPAVESGSLLMELGVAGILIYLVLREMLTQLFKFLDKKKGEDGRGPAAASFRDVFGLLRDMRAHVAELHKWHDKDDEDGVKVWYNRKSLGQSIDRLAESTTQFTASVMRLNELLERQESD